MKTVALIARRADHDRDAFRKHYEEIHAPLAIETVMEGTTRYVRYHLTEELHGQPAFDVVTEFRYRDAAAAAALMKRLQGEAGRRILADEQSFMDRERNTFFGVTEHPIRGAEDRSAGLQLVVLAKASPDTDAASFVQAYEQTDLPALLDATSEPLWCQQNRSFAVGPEPPAFDLVTHVHARGDAGVGAWARSLEAPAGQLLVLGVTEHESQMPWQDGRAG